MLILPLICQVMALEEPDSALYCAGRLIFTRKRELADYSERDFYTEACISRSGFQRLLKSLDLPSFAHFRELILQDMTELEARTAMSVPLTSQTKALRAILEPGRRVVFYCDLESRAVLLAWLPWLYFHNPDIHIYPHPHLSEERLHAYRMQKKDLIVFCSLTMDPVTLKVACSRFLGKCQANIFGTCTSLFIGQKGADPDWNPPAIWLEPDTSLSGLISQFSRILESLLT